MALVIHAAYELFGFLLRPWVDVAQQPLQRERASPDQIGRIFNGLLWQTVHLGHYSNARADSSVEWVAGILRSPRL